MQLQQIPVCQEIAPEPLGHASVLVSVTGGSVAGTDETHCDLVLWACGLTEGCLTRKVRERRWKFMSNTKHFVSGVV